MAASASLAVSAAPPGRCNLPAGMPGQARARPMGQAAVCRATKIKYQHAVWGLEGAGIQLEGVAMNPGPASNVLPLPNSAAAGMKSVANNTCQAEDLRQSDLAACHPRALTGRITSCRSWQDLRAVLQEHAQQMNTVHLSALVTRLAWVETPIAEPGACLQPGLESFLQDVSSLVSRDLDKLDPRGLANILWAVARLGFRPSYTLIQRYLFAAYLQLPHMQPQELANLGWAAATMGLRPTAAWLQLFYQQAARRAPGMRAQELANLTWAITCLLPAQPTQTPAQHNAPAPATTSLAELVHTLHSSAMQQLPSFKVSELMMMLMALHKLHVSDHCAGRSTEAALQQGYSRLLIASLPQLSSQLQWLNQQDVSSLVCLVAWDSQRPAVRSTWGRAGARSVVCQLCRHVEQDTLHRCATFTKRALIRLLWGLATLGARPCAAWQSACWTAVLGSSQAASNTSRDAHLGHGCTWDASSLITFLWCLARLQPHHNTHHSDAHAAQIASGAAHSMSALISQEASVCSRSSDVQKDDSTVAAPTQHVAQHVTQHVFEPGLQQLLITSVPSLSLLDLCQLVWSLGKLRCELTQGLATALTDAVQARVANAVQAHVAAAAAAEVPGLNNNSTTSTISRSGGGTASMSSRSSGGGPASPCSRLSLHKATQLLSGLATLQLHVQPPTIAAILHLITQELQPQPDTPPTPTPATWQSAAAQQQVRQRDFTATLHRCVCLCMYLAGQHAPVAGGQTAAQQHSQPPSPQQQGPASQSAIPSCCGEPLSMAVEQLARGAHHLSVPRVYKLLCRLSSARVPLSPVAVHLLVQQLAPHLQWLPAGLLSRALVAVVQLQFTPGPAWADACLRLLHERMNTCSLRDLSCVLWSLAKWQVVPPLAWWHRCIGRLCRLTRHHHQQRSVRGRVTTTSAAVRALWALHKLHAKAPRLKSRLTQMALAGVGALSTSEAVWLLHILTSSEHQLLRSQWKRILKRITANNNSSSGSKLSSGSGTSRRVVAAAPLAPHMLRHQPLTRRQVKAVQWCMHRKVMSWSRRWPVWLKAQGVVRRAVVAQAAQL